ncbi:FkbM family methyltransferase [Actinokineospora guangxiensis]|uniref:FkbM family methyltransferase n=1 Tax=Actinokineospora guangxiensis TaxID=1490288 RepID=A0ABW0EHX8_9PSEU
MSTLPRPRLRRAEPPTSRVNGWRIDGVAALGRLHAAATRGALRMPVLAVLDRLLPSGRLPDVTASVAGGAGMRLRGAVARAALIAGGYEHREVELCAAALRPGGVFLDVGANHGWFSLVVGHARPDAAVWAVEAVPATAEVLAANLSGTPNARVVRSAVGSCRDSVLLSVPEDDAFARLGTDGTPCPQVPLDELWADFGAPRVDAVKIDVEGSEVDVLRGARGLLERDRPLLVVEAPTAADARAVRAEVAALGYRLRAVPGVLPYNAVLVA